MSLAVFSVKKNALADRLYFRFDPVVNLTGLSLLFSMKVRLTGAVKIDKAAAQIATGAHIIDGVSNPALTAADGWGYYDWVGTDLDTIGNYDGEPWIVYPGPRYSKWPGKGFIPIEVGEDAP